MNILCKLGFHRYRVVRETEDIIYKGCVCCPKRKAEKMFYSDCKVYRIDYDWLDNLRSVPRSRMEIIGPKPKLKGGCNG